MSKEWDELIRKQQHIVKLKIEKQIQDQTVRGVVYINTFEISYQNDHYHIMIRNTEHNSVMAGIKLTKEEFDAMAREIYKLIEPTNIIEALR